jgi:hypothetical protein
MQDFLGPLSVGVIQDPKLDLALGGRQLAHRRGQQLVFHDGEDALGGEKILGVMHDLEIERAEDPLHRSNKASALAAQMKSFSDRPPMACVEYSTRHLL